MKDTDKEYLKELLRLDISQSDSDETRRILEDCGDVKDTLANPLITHDEKRGIITKLFPENMQKFLMTLVRNGDIERIDDILEEYDDILLDRQGSIRAVVRYVTPLTESQQADLRKFITDKLSY